MKKVLILGIMPLSIVLTVKTEPLKVHYCAYTSLDRSTNTHASRLVLCVEVNDNNGNFVQVVSGPNGAEGYWDYQGKFRELTPEELKDYHTLKQQEVEKEQEARKAADEEQRRRALNGPAPAATYINRVD